LLVFLKNLIVKLQLKPLNKKTFKLSN